MTRYVSRPTGQQSAREQAEEFLKAHPQKPETDDLDFWNARPELAQIHQTALATFASPWAAFAATLARVSAATSPRLVLPGAASGSVGRECSLNIYVGICGISGQGKDVADDAAENALPLPVRVHGPGSGEGILHGFVHYDNSSKEIMQHNTSILLKAREVTKLMALKSRSASTLFSELNLCWTGARTGALYVDKTKALSMERHSYKLNMTVGIQVGNAYILLNDSDSGTPQRYLWFWGTNPDAPTVDDTPPLPEPLDWNIAEWYPALSVQAADRRLAEHPIPNMTGRLEVMKVCEKALREIKENSRKTLMGEVNQGHDLLGREKVAGTLALLNKRVDISEEDWQLAGVVAEKSARCRADVAQANEEKNHDVNTARGRSLGEQRVKSDEVVEDAIRRKASKAVMDCLVKANGDWVTGGVLRDKIQWPHRDVFGDVIGGPVGEGVVEHRSRRYHGQDIEDYRLVP